MVDEIKSFSYSDVEKSEFLPFISIVIPVFNGCRTIQLCLDAILQLDYPRNYYEVIVVDNNSTDGTPEFVRQYPVRLIFEREYQGPHAATNTGILQGCGEIIAFTDADCVPKEDWLNKLVAPFIDEEVVAVGGRIEAFKPSSSVERFLNQAKPLKNCVRLSESFPMSIITANAAYRTKVLQKVGLFNKKMYTGAEVDLAWRVQWETRKRAVYVDDSIVYHKFSPSVRTMFRHFRIYGFSEIMLATLYKDIPGYPLKPIDQLHLMLRQLRAIFTYIGSFLYRFIIFLFYKRDIDYVLSPVFCFISETGNLYGKLEAMWLTRYYRKQFWQDGPRVI
jgi:cellulose synthase/poly-beta-1,6-N-acetylglucosamine synthase-like glycosyltransferase